MKYSAVASEEDFVVAVKLATLEMRVHALVDSLEVRHWSTQPRVPRGSDRGGEWTRVGSSRPKDERRRVAFGAILKFEKRLVEDPILGFATKCFYRDILDRWFAVMVGAEKECPPTYPADPSE
jgi:hypothetical protein